MEGGERFRMPLLVPRMNITPHLAVAVVSLFTLSLKADSSPAIVVTLTKRAPVETLSATGQMTGVSEGAIGTQFILLAANGSRLTVQDQQGGLHRLLANCTDYVLPAVPAPVAPAGPTGTAADSNAAPAVPAPAAPSSTTTLAASSGISTPTGNPSPALDLPLSDNALETINAGLGKPLFSAKPFWNESALLIASRLGLQLEDKTKWETAYRRYFYDEKFKYAPAPMLGGAAYCIALYADANDTPTSMLIAFTNDGDYQSVGDLISDLYRLKHPEGKPPDDADAQIAKLEASVDTLKTSFETARKAEEESLVKNLTALFNEPQRTSFGSDAATRENALRWDWNGVSFLLTCQENKYNLLRIVPTGLADNQGRTERIPHDEMVAKLAGAVEHRPNGDVIITQIPMADQGQKGYCVPATWERVLRYTGVPGDMYTLSRIGDADFGGGERGGTVATQLDSTLHNYGRRAEFFDMDKIDAISLHRYIDAGIPVFWTLNPGGYKPSEQRYALSDRDKDWDEWKALLEQSRLEAKSKKTPLIDDGYHQVIITGYNADTKEIAWSDPWGRHTKERWMTVEEAERCSFGQFYIITL